MGEDYLPLKRRIFLSCNSSLSAAEQFHNDVSFKAVDQRAPNNLKNWQWKIKVTSEFSNRHLLHMAINDCTDSSWQLAARWSTAIAVLMSALSIVKICCTVDYVQGCLYILSPLTANHQWLHLQWAHEHRVRQADRHQVVFSNESHYDLWDHDSSVRVRHYDSQHCLLECVIE